MKESGSVARITSSKIAMPSDPKFPPYDTKPFGWGSGTVGRSSGERILFRWGTVSLVEWTRFALREERHCQ